MIVVFSQDFVYDLQFFMSWESYSQFNVVNLFHVFGFWDPVLMEFQTFCHKW